MYWCVGEVVDSDQYNETNVTHFLFSLLRMKGLQMFRANPQELLHKRYLVYYVRIMSVGCYQDWSGNTNLDYVILLFLCNSGCTNAPPCHVICQLSVLLDLQRWIIEVAGCVQ
jgi:hypothetical protein